ncbi:dihydrodipicolinate synthase family protein [Shumkonia mesophila]|uniref:dihydrodipicolinate synthase family protein n=1 Tax=Shumkonia mesophila TaxID=2838854 RepID=UPI0029347BA0|nr:dihydrodipicolinate synthase family protein [Shumkonia mesophila]
MIDRDAISGRALPRGIVPSLNTPFTADGTLDTEAYGRLIDYVIAAGCGGVLLPAVAGEIGSLSRAERERLIEAASARNAGRIPMIVGVSAAAWPESLALARHARAAGADAVLWQPEPGLSENALEKGLAALGEAGPGAVVLQDLDWRGGGLGVEIIAALFARVPAFAGIKVETVPAGPKYSAIQAATGGRLHVSGGWAVSQMMDALARGVDAFMPTGMEPIYCEIYRRHEAGRPEEARALFEAILPILAFANQHIEVSIRFFKALRRAAGLFATDACRPPVAALDAVQDRECRRLVDWALEIERNLSQA